MEKEEKDLTELHIDTGEATLRTTPEKGATCHQTVSRETTQTDAREWSHPTIQQSLGQCACLSLDKEWIQPHTCGLSSPEPSNQI